MGDRATLFCPHYPFVNLPPEQTRKGKKTFANVIYGEQSLTDAGRGLVAATTPIAEGRRLRIEPSKRLITGRRRNIREPLVRLDDTAETGSGFDGGPALTHAGVVAPGPPPTPRIVASSAAAHFENNRRGMRNPCCCRRGNLLCAMRLTRPDRARHAESHARVLCDSEARLPTRELLAPVIGE